MSIIYAASELPEKGCPSCRCLQNEDDCRVEVIWYGAPLNLVFLNAYYFYFAESHSTNCGLGYRRSSKAVELSVDHSDEAMQHLVDGQDDEADVSDFCRVHIIERKEPEVIPSNRTSYRTYTDLWKCCLCGSTNMKANAPENCPVCGHVIDSSCIW
jgi:hypothetical protein